VCDLHHQGGTVLERILHSLPHASHLAALGLLGHGLTAVHDAGSLDALTSAHVCLATVLGAWALLSGFSWCRSSHSFVSKGNRLFSLFSIFSHQNKNKTLDYEKK